MELQINLGVKAKLNIEAFKKATVELKLHSGKAPPWLISRMIKLAKPLIELIVDEYGYRELLKRLSDPLWFQALSYILGYDWDSSGVTTVTIGVLKTVLSEEHGILLAGGKGEKARETQRELEKIGEKFGFTDKKIGELKEISRVVAKVDNALIQDGYSIYHHAMFVAKNGDWAVIQQGMNTTKKLARRYHWYSKESKNFVVEPHKGIVGQIKHPFVIDITSRQSLDTQKTSLDLVREGPQQIKKDLSYLETLVRGNKQLDYYFKTSLAIETASLKIIAKKPIYVKLLPKKVNWRAIEEAYQLNPRNYEELIKIQGIGQATVRALALISELIYNASLSWEDPIRYTFAVGGKDGVPYPVNIKVMEEVSELLEKALEEKKIGKEEFRGILKRLSKLRNS